ncbi:hypothetical protein YC2023_017917 [Brassica napus]
MGVSRSLEYLVLETVTRKKLDLMDGFIREKPALAAQTQSREDLNSIKALPATNQEEEETETDKDFQEVVTEQDQEGDSLDEVGETVGTVAGDSLALALFDGAVETETASEQPGWERFDDDSADWETALVKSATRLSGQKSELGGGFDPFLLDGMYQHGAVKSSTAYGGSGSASSVACGSAGRPPGKKIK